MKPPSHPLFDRIETSKNLPTLPHIVLKLIDACNRQGSTIKDISQIINKDTSLSAKVMSMVNSAHHGFPTRVTSVEQHLHLLGMDAIKNIAINTAVLQVFDEAKDHGVFKLKLFWRHSLLCATLSELIAKKTSYSFPDEAFLSGLLHDIGKLILCVNFPDEYSDILQSSNNKSELLLAGEMRLIRNLRHLVFGILAEQQKIDFVTADEKLLNATKGGVSFVCTLLLLSMNNHLQTTRPQTSAASIL